MQTNADVNACVLVPHHTDNETESRNIIMICEYYRQIKTLSEHLKSGEEKRKRHQTMFLIIQSHTQLLKLGLQSVKQFKESESHWNWF